MLTLANDALRLELIDPRDPADQPHLGSRFAHGGLIWQICDKKAGPMLTGPEWAEPNPSPFNAQGLTESFRHRTRLFSQFTWRDGVGVAIGCGRIALDAASQVILTAACEWHVDESRNRILFSTHDAFAGFDYALTREIVLTGRTITTTSRLTNRGGVPLILEWFAHPFFALKDGFIRAKLPREIAMPDNPGFALNDGELTLKRRFTGALDGHMEVVPWPAGAPCAFAVDHPAIAGIEMELRGVVPFECVFWGNGNTFSIEPYVHLEIPVGDTREFSLRYTLGE